MLEGFCYMYKVFSRLTAMSQHLKMLQVPHSRASHSATNITLKGQKPQHKVSDMFKRTRKAEPSIYDGTEDLEDISQIIPNIYLCFLHTDSQNEMPKYAKQEDKVGTEYSGCYTQTEGVTTIL